jgi:hypothetical protein
MTRFQRKKVLAVSEYVCPTYPNYVIERRTKHMGTFGGFTRWAIVFLIIFVLFILLVPATGGY